jgi:uncharacterized protein
MRVVTLATQRAAVALELAREGYRELSRPITLHPEYLRLQGFKHHGESIYEHCQAVARVCYAAGRVLRLRLPELVRGALLHDFFMYDWRLARKPGERAHAFSHPRIALENSERVFGALSPLERDIISRHMWPLTLLPPRSVEGMLVCVADKLVAAWEFAFAFYRALLSFLSGMLKAARLRA